MSERTEQLIGELVDDLVPVQRLPPLWKVAATGIGMAAAFGVFARTMAALAGQAPLKPSLQPFDLLGLGAQLAMAAGALTIALASCVPGRESLRLAGAWTAAAAGALWLVAIATLLGAERSEPLSWVVLHGTALCTLNSLVPALVLALPLRRFVARARPHRPDLALFAGIVAAASFACAPVHLACELSGVMHGLVAHLGAPLLSAVVVFAALRLR